VGEPISITGRRYLLEEAAYAAPPRDHLCGPQSAADLDDPGAVTYSADAPYPLLPFGKLLAEDGTRPIFRGQIT
jgi:hypothetical protein